MRRKKLVQILMKGFLAVSRFLSVRRIETKLNKERQQNSKNKRKNMSTTSL